MPTAEFGQGQIFAHEEPAPLAIRKAPKNRQERRFAQGCVE